MALRDKVSLFFRNHKKGFIIGGIAIGGLLVLSLFYVPADSPSNSTPGSYNIASSVVNIVCVSKNSNEESGGSGTIISEDGTIITNAHVIPQVGEVPSVLNDRCLIALPDEATGQPKEFYLAKPEITKDLSKQYDIAILRIDSVYTDKDGKTWGTYPKTFPELQGNSNCAKGHIKLGDSLKIYGYPVTSGGYNLTVTDGVVSSFNSDGTILTSAKIDSGNSGGLAVDYEGCFIGIPSAIVQGNYQNLGVIIPPNLIKDFSDEVPAKIDRSVVSCNTDQCYFDGKCIRRAVHSTCVADDPNNAWVCDEGYVESGNYCVVSAPVVPQKTNDEICQDKYGWNTYWDGTYCQCNNNYIWNKTNTACISRTESCQQTWQNTYWDGTYSADGKFNCNCTVGYTWNTTNTACVSKASVDQSCKDKYGYNSYYMGYVEDGKYMCY